VRGARACSQSSQTVQSLIDGVLPGLVTLGLFGLMWFMLKKKWNPMLIMLIILVVSIGAAYVGILGA